jgi:putative spermidine/putrescine transport system ATP-binding protein
VSAIELDAVSKRYGAVAAVDGVSLAVEQGEFVTILGPSGSGKSTMLNLIAGLAAPSGGRILIGGRDVTALPPSQRNVGLVFQNYALFPNMTVARNVGFPLWVRGVARGEVARRVATALQLVRLVGLEARRPSELSGGQQQRVALARAIVFEPDILLLDEPLAALDRKLREEVRVELRRLQRALGITTVLVTHDQEEALSLSDRMFVLEGGRVRQSGPPDALYLRPMSRFVADFLGLANFVEGRVENDAGRPAIRTADGALVACAPTAAPPGSAVTAILRPERVRLDDGDGLPAGVTEVIYLGQQVRYHLALEGGRVLIAVAPDRTARHELGASVRAAWHAHDVWIIPEM